MAGANPNGGASFDAILPPVFKPDEFMKALVNEANKFATVAQKAFQDTTRGHSHPAQFTKTVSNIAGMIRVRVTTTAEYYKYFDQGSRPHIIRARKRALHWTAGGEDAFAKQVRHPGFKGHHYSEGLSNELQSDFKDHMDAALIEGREKCMHAI